MQRSPDFEGIEFRNPGETIRMGNGEVYDDIKFARLILIVLHRAKMANDTLIPTDAVDPTMELTREGLGKFVNGLKPRAFMHENEIPAVAGMCRIAYNGKVESYETHTENQYSRMPAAPLLVLADILDVYELQSEFMRSVEDS